MTVIDTEHEGGGSGTYNRSGGSTRAPRQHGRYRRRVIVAIAAVGAAIAGLTAPEVQFSNDPYATNLQLIQGQSFRNTNTDTSPFRDWEQDELPTTTGGGLIDTNRAAYLGNPNGNPEQAFPVSSGGQMRTACEFSHFAYDDPILFPRQPGRAHLHMFFGNTDVNAYSTYDTLIDSGGGTCSGGELNRTGYWAPAMIDPDPSAPGGAYVRIPERVVVYYKGEGLANGSNYAFPNAGSALYPPEAAMIANVSTGTPAGISVPEWPTFDGGDTGQVNFKCSNNFSAFPPATGINQIPNCNGDYWANTFGATFPVTRMVLEVEIKFWTCLPVGANPADWTQWQPAGPTRGSWFYSNCTGEGGQGAGSPPLNDKTIFPNLSVFINYVVLPGEDTSDWFLSSDVDPATITNPNPSLLGLRGSTLHSDWWGGWHPDINQQWLDNCTNFSTGAPSGCGMGYLTDGGADGNNPAAGPTLVYRDQYDTVGDPNSYRAPLQTVFNELCAPHSPAHSFSQPEHGALCLVTP